MANDSYESIDQDNAKNYITFLGSGSSMIPMTYQTNEDTRKEFSNQMPQKYLIQGEGDGVNNIILTRQNVVRTAPYIPLK